ncbi:hypothetical protein FPQ18DRAFT_310830 [Pyronema domesticum]|uniref:Uncharacterized protein n=1 Tax=Pyronema omphalodes (strain CBS 100304) TaxID=1076935 RepID=U4LPI7_PYROM|nr:hypothetical protein FPQ18DRAFT_310830 [Pyronema domesticum]CCX34081.1 Protein of unknown function [Pyronema omphalodes CBS 100304]
MLITMLIALFITIVITRLQAIWRALPHRNHRNMSLKLQLGLIIFALLLKAVLWYLKSLKLIELAKLSQLCGPHVPVPDDVDNGHGIVTALESSDFIINITGNSKKTDLPWPNLEPNTLVVQHFWHDH